MSVEDVGSLLSRDEEKALLPLRAKWEKELASVEEQLTTLNNRKAELTRILASLDGILPRKDPGAVRTAVSLPQRPAHSTGPVSSVPTESILTQAVTNERKRFTPVEAYWLPLLQALVELGGRARRDEVVELVGRKMEGTLTPDDHELLPSGIEVRWKNRVAWQRENMKRRGLLRDDSPQGVWEITEAGRQWLQAASSQRIFYTLSALRIGNLSGDRPHPVTLGAYRNFVRQWAREFGDPALGEAQDYIFLDPMVLLWKDGRMELKKYDLTRNLWWDFSELRDLRSLVGTGDWTMKLTPEGRALLATLEEQAVLMNKKRADIQRLREQLEDAPISLDLLTNYVRELELHRSEEDIFIRLAFRDLSVGGATGRGDTYLTSAYSELYDQPLDPNQKREARRWWHDRMQREANRHDDLKARLAKLS